MKVLQVNCVYNTGSTGKIMYDVHVELQKQNIDSVVCYGRGVLVNEKNVYKTCGELYSHINHAWANLTGVLYGGCFFSTNRLLSIIRKEQPDIVHLHCINGYFVNIYRLVNWLKKNGIKTVLTLHAEFMYTGGCGHSVECEQWKTSQGCGQTKCPRYRSDMHAWLFDRSGTMWKRMKKAFSGFNEGLVITSVSPWLKDRAEASPILAGKPHCVVMNGIDTEVFHPYNETDCSALKKQLSIDNEKVVFHATASFNDNPKHLKGGYYLIQLAKRMPEVTFVVAGSAQENICVPENVMFLGRITDQKKLAQLYAMADVTLLTSQRETFSMVTAESLCCGTPVVGFKAGAPEMIALKEHSRFVEYGDLEALQAAVTEMLNRPAALIEPAAQMFSKQTMTQGYLTVYQELME